MALIDFEQIPDGTQALPGLRFNSEPTLGFYRKAAGTLAFSPTATVVVDNTTDATNSVTGSFQTLGGIGVAKSIVAAGNASSFGGSTDQTRTFNVALASNALTLVRIINTNAGASAGAGVELGNDTNFAYLTYRSSGASAANTFQIFTQTTHNLDLGANGVLAWRIQGSASTQHLLATTDNTYNIGASGATRPKNLYVAGFFELGGAGSTNNQFSTASTGAGTTTMFIGNASINVTSDIRLKRNIAPTIIDATALFRRMRVVDFEWNDPSDRAIVNRNSRGRWTGMIAQDNLDLVPWIYNMEDRTCADCRAGRACRWHGSIFVEYEHLVPLIVKGYQELDARITALERRLHETQPEQKAA